MNELNVGKILPEDPGRDAIHIAVAPAIAICTLFTGQHVGLHGGKAGHSDNPIGIVDPYLDARVYPDERFYIFLYPNTVTSLRHQWTHPAFDGGPSTSEELSKAWIVDFSERIGLAYSTVMEAAKEWLTGGDYYIFNGRSTPDECFEQAAEFWKHYEVVTHEKVESKENFFSCTC